MGELELRPEEFGNYTIAEIDAMFRGWQRRYEHLEDLFIVDCAMPVYRGAYGRKAPTYRQLTKHRHHDKPVGEIPQDVVDFWHKHL